MIRVLVLAVIAVLAAGAGLFVAGGRAAGPSLEIVRPADLVGRSATLEFVIETPDGALNAVEAVIEQGGQIYPLFSLDRPTDGEVRQEASDVVWVSRQFDRTSHPDLTAGEATIAVSATRPVVFGLREASTTIRRDVEVRLDPPRLGVVSTFHFVNHGGSELVVYRVTPADAESGVRVGDRFYPGYAVGTNGDDDTLRAAFFALSYDQDLEAPIDLFARDAAGNEGEAAFDHQVFPKQFRRSQIPVGDAFLRRVVPPIVARSPELADEALGQDPPVDELRDLYLFINRTLRQRNRETVAALAGDTVEHMMWDDAFRQLANTRVESGFADYRTYSRDGRDIDQQVHLGFDLASTANAPVRAANDGRVVFADYLGIFGNCVVIDHGMGLQSLYAHLSSIDVSVDQPVSADQQIGLSGQTGLAGGDHLHFAMLLQGRPVNPVEWWDAHWLEDRVFRKLRDASSP